MTRPAATTQFTPTTPLSSLESPKHPSLKPASAHQPVRSIDSEHIVHFYQDDTFLINSLTQYISSGLDQQEICLVIATLDHQQMLNQQLSEQFDLKDLQSTGRLQYWDAAIQADELIVDGHLDRQLFANRFGQLVAEYTQAGERVRGFGEIVSLLWAKGLPGQAVELEKAWHDLGDQWSFSLLCAYSIRHVNDPSQTDFLHQVCLNHTQSIPDFSSLQSRLQPVGEVV